MNNQQFLDLGKKVQLGNVARTPVVLVRGEGRRIWDADGREYLDLSSGIAVTLLGHSHPGLTQAMAEQAARLTHVSNIWYNDKAIELADALTRRTGASKVYFCHSGTEANEAMLKLARRYQFEQGRPERTEIIATHNSFHGRTFGSLSVTGQPKYHQGMGPMLPGISFVEYGNIEALKAAVGPKTAAIILEPIQAEGGIIVPSDQYLRDIRALCDASGVLMLIDEVQTGYGRTGKFSACEWPNVKPDASSWAKAMGGGFPLGAMLVSEKASGGLPPGTHSTTQGGNPLACAVGLAVLKLMDEENLIEHARQQGEYLASRLAAMAKDTSQKVVTEQRGRGLIQGLLCSPKVEPAKVVTAIREAGVLVSMAGGTVIRFTPALNITREELDEGLERVTKVLHAFPVDGA